MAGRCRMFVPATTWAYLSILAVVVVGAIMREINLLIILSGMMAGPLVISWQLIQSTLRDLTFSRKLPRGVFPGQAFVVEVAATNPRRRLDAWALHIEDRLERVTPGTAAPSEVAQGLIAHLPAWQTRSMSYRARLAERGRYRFGPLRISTQVPVGLLRGCVKHDVRADVLVYPSLGQLKASLAELVRLDKPGTQSWQRRHGAIEGDFFGLREWRAGDSRRWIHWRSSAKRNELVVRQFEQHRQQDLVMLLDLGQLPADLPAADPRWQRIELAISFAATVVAEQCRLGAGGLTLVVAARDLRMVRGTASSALFHDILELLADAAPTSLDPLPELVANTLARTSPQDHLLLISTGPVDLTDPMRFPFVAPENARSARLARAVCIDVGSPQFAQLFSSAGEPQARPVGQGASR